MTNKTRLTRSGYSFHENGGVWIKYADKETVMLVVDVHKDKTAMLIINERNKWDGDNSVTNHGTVKLAIAAGEAYLAERAAEQKAAAQRAADWKAVM